MVARSENQWLNQVPGIPDRFFQRGQVPMTKAEIRVVTLAKGKIFQEAVVYDLGSGTGSIAIEAALLAPHGRVFAYERRAEAVELIKQNQLFFGADNLQIFRKEAPEGLEELPRADCIFIGGSGGRLPEIMEKSLNQLRERGRVVVNAITVETLQQSLIFAQEKNLDCEVVNVAVARAEKVGASHLWKAFNPINIITLTRKLYQEKEVLP